MQRSRFSHPDLHRTLRYVSLGLALSAGCTLDNEDGDSLSETSQELYEPDGTTLWNLFGTIPVCFAYSSGAVTLPVSERAAVTAFVKERVALTWGAILPFQISWRDCPTSGDESDVLFDLSSQNNGGVCFTAGASPYRG